jgi:hypothetical protein
MDPKVMPRNPKLLPYSTPTQTKGVRTAFHAGNALAVRLITRKLAAMQPPYTTVTKISPTTGR